MAIKRSTRSTPRAGGTGGRVRYKKSVAKYTIPADTKVDYKNLALVQKYVTDRGKMLSRRITGVNGKQQRELSIAIKRARYLGLLPVGGVKKKN